MSYFRMDHAAWMESQNQSINRLNSTRRGKAHPTLPEKLSSFQARVIDIVGIVGGGIYNAPICSPERIVWTWGFNGVSLTWRGGLSSFDRGDLTLLVFLCHEARIRIEIDPAGPRRLRLSFFPRRPDGELWARHPDLAEAVAQFQGALSPESTIRYRCPSVLEPEAAHA